MTKLILFLGLCVGIACVASAQSTPKVGKTQARQTVRIADGVANGELTQREARHLKNQQRYIQHEKNVAKADGVVTSNERKKIRHDQRIANRSIRRQKHDLQGRL
jgi:hypothetical protein